MQYTTSPSNILRAGTLFYQDFKDTFVCNTQLIASSNSKAFVVLSGFQRYFCMQYTTSSEGSRLSASCFIRISKILLYAIHNLQGQSPQGAPVVLSGFQRYFCMQYTTYHIRILQKHQLFYQDFKDTFVCNTQPGRPRTE